MMTKRTELLLRSFAVPTALVVYFAGVLLLKLTTGRTLAEWIIYITGGS